MENGLLNIIKLDMRKISFIVEETNCGYSAFAEDFPVYTTGEDMAGLKYNILEALDLYLEEAEGKNVEIGKKENYNCSVVLLPYEGWRELDIIECCLITK